MSEAPTRAIVFDLDGVLVDSEPVHWRAAQRLVAPHAISEEEYARFTGVAITPFMEWVRARFELAGSIEALTRRYGTLVTEELHSGPIEPLDGARELIAAAREGGWSVGLASQSLAEWVAVTLRACGLKSAFDVEINGNDVANGKPAPDIYLRAASLLGVAPARCVAVEDAPAGVQSAAAAGMLVVQSRQASTAAAPQPEADLVVGSLREVELGALAERLADAGAAR